MTRLNKKNSGFTIIELSIVFTILALIGTVGLSFFASRAEAEREKVTSERMEYVMKAIEDYVHHFGYLPCPANGEDQLDDAWFSRSDKAVGLCTTFNYSAATTDLTGGVVVGVVPTGELNIAPYYMMDGWSKRITYIVDEDLVNSGDIADPAKTADIMIYDKVYGENEDPFGPRVNVIRNVVDDFLNSVEDDEDTGAAVLIISHGKNGQGAWQYKGVIARSNKEEVSDDDAFGGAPGYYTLEGENNHLVSPAKFDNYFVYFPLWEQRCIAPCAGGALAGGDQGTFDDILIWRTKQQLQNL